MVHGKTNEDGQSCTKFLEKQQGKNYYALVVQSVVNNNKIYKCSLGSTGKLVDDKTEKIPRS